MQILRRMSNFNDPTVELRSCEVELQRAAQKMEDDQKQFGHFELQTQELFVNTLSKARNVLRHQQSQF